jgi:DNA (cytosine-5)-methyltransferase 1
MNQSKIPPLITGSWKRSDVKKTHGLTVFSCFHCGGGSSFGYKLAGFDVFGGVEIDPEMMNIYRANHNPKYSYLMGVEEFKNIPDSELPIELFNLDVLDGSPPCSSFSMAGSREDAWDKKKKFREGQVDQVLDDLFFHFIDIAEKLKPKIVVAENVKGLLVGAARGYVKEIFAHFRRIGYEPQLFLLNASKMGVPQARERTFFIARRADLNIPKIELLFDETARTVANAFDGLNDNSTGKILTERARDLYLRTVPGDSFAKANNGSWFNWIRLRNDRPANTLPATCMLCHPSEPRFISYPEAVRLQSFPEDYDFLGVDARYVCGMSVPPLMMQRVASKVAGLLLDSSQCVDL